MADWHCPLCGTTDPAAAGAAIGICLDAAACRRRQAERREYRAWLAEMIARAVEDAAPPSGERRAQALADAALARKMATR